MPGPKGWSQKNLCQHLAVNVWAYLLSLSLFIHCSSIYSVLVIKLVHPFWYVYFCVQICMFNIAYGPANVCVRVNVSVLIFVNLCACVCLLEGA